MTRDDLEFMRMVAQQTGRSSALAEQEYVSELLQGEITAAIISKPKLLVVSVNLGGPSGPVVQPHRTRSFELADRSSSSVRTLKAELERFAESAELTDVFLRTVSAKKSDYCPHGFHFKIETILQLVNSIRLTFVSEGSVGSWVRRTEPDLPPTSSLGMGKYWDNKRDLALETALFVADNALEGRYFWDGAERDV